MTNLEMQMLSKVGITEKEIKPKKVEEVIEISREDFDLLDVEEDTMYHIIEVDGTVTIKKGVNR